MTAIPVIFLALLLKILLWAGWVSGSSIIWFFSSCRHLFMGFWLLPGVLILATPSPVHAGWLWGPDPRVEAANKALERAAQIATEAARTQSSQHTKFLEAVESLSNERTQLAGHLKHLSDVANRDSAWASALNTIGPVFVSVAVLGVAGLAIWLSTRAGSHDAQLATVLVDELAGTGSSPLLLSSQPRGQVPGLGYTHGPRFTSNTNPEEEMPF